MKRKMGDKKDRPKSKLPKNLTPKNVDDIEIGCNIKESMKILRDSIDMNCSSISALVAEAYLMGYKDGRESK